MVEGLDRSNKTLATDNWENDYTIQVLREDRDKYKECYESLLNSERIVE